MEETMNTLSYKDLFNYINSDYNNEEVIKWEGFEITVKKLLPLEAVDAFVNTVVNAVFQDGEYDPMYLEYSILLSTMFAYTDIRPPEDDDVDYSNYYCQLFYGTDLCDTILEVVNADQYNSMLDIIDEKINYRIESDIDKISRQINELSDFVKEFGNQFSDNLPAVQALLTSLENGEISIDKVLDAFANKLRDSQFGDETNVNAGD